jgi:aminoglycoside/choline kinase family phosphotransferase
MSDFLARLHTFLAEKNEPAVIQQLTPDASTREYFRVGWKDSTAIACVYPDPSGDAARIYRDVTHLFTRGGLPVARILDFSEALGVIVQEDLGDRILRDMLVDVGGDIREKLIVSAIALIPQIQAATPTAFRLRSIASQLRFDEEKLLWELDFFKTHYFTTYKNEPLPSGEDETVTAEFVELSRELESRATVLCHRDFHAANLMIDGNGVLRIIDHQDARLGSVAYDLVSFLLDRVTEPPSAAWLAEKRWFFLNEREKSGLEKIAEDVFAEEFRLQTIQRCLKAIGTFSFQSANRGKTYFVPFIKPMFEIVLRAIANLDRFPEIRKMVEREIDT